MYLTKTSYLKPQLIVSAIDRISLAELWNDGIRGLIIDLDNTICPWKQNKVITEADVLIKDALRRKYKVCLISNASYRRTKEIAELYSIPFFAPAYKPSKYTFKKAISLMGLKKKEVAVVGDQLFTDMLGGNRAGCYTILVPPLSKEEFIWTRFMRHLERMAMSRSRNDYIN
jgi:HAD superfamily phosphatase (TIGR01668 family)